MQVHLVVVRPFGTYRTGDVITDDTKVAAVQRSENAHDVVRVAAQAAGTSQPRKA
jgi:hypothetical protein